MTLFLLLVGMAITEPFVFVAMQTSQLGLIGSLVGMALAVVACVIQFVVHHKFMYWTQDKLDDSWAAIALITVYYAAIPTIGVLCAIVILDIARYVAFLSGVSAI